MADELESRNSRWDAIVQRIAEEEKEEEEKTKQNKEEENPLPQAAPPSDMAAEFEPMRAILDSLLQRILDEQAEQNNKKVEQVEQNNEVGKKEEENNPQEDKQKLKNRKKKEKKMAAKERKICDIYIQSFQFAIEQRVREEEEKDKWKKMWSEIRTGKRQSDLAGGGDAPVPHDVENVHNASQPMLGEEQEDIVGTSTECNIVAEPVRSDSAGGDDLDPVPQHDVGPSLIVEAVPPSAMAYDVQVWETAWDQDSGEEELWEFSKTEKRQSDSAGAGGGDDPPNLVAQDVGPPLIVKGFNIEVSNHFYNGVVTIGFPNDDQLKNMKKFESLRVLPRSFIPCSDRQLDQMEHIESLGERNPLFLFPKEVMNCEVEGGNVRNFIVAEEMLSVGEYFEDQLRKYFKSKGWEVETFVVTSPKEVRLGRLCEWWEYIRLNFISIFRELIHALLYHYRIIGKPIGNLEENVFVTKRHSKVRVLPSMDDSKTFEADIRDLCKMMRKSVLPTFLAKVEVNVEQVVSRAFRWFLDFVSKRKGAASKSDITSICSIIDHPFIWSSKDRIRFIRKIHRWCKNDHETYHLIDKNLRKKFRNGNNQVHWKQQVTHPVLVAILNKPLEPSSTVKSYVNFVEIIRFHNAVYSYYNEKEYESLRSKDLNEDEIDEILISQFPLLCVWVKTIVLNRLTNNLKRIPTEDGRQVMEDLFSFEH